MTAIREVLPGSNLFQQVIKLWRAESQTLGLMPEGAFEDAARAGCLVAAQSPDGRVVGYAMFRRSRRGIASIAHLAVSAESRGRGVARALFEEVKKRCRDCYEIRLRCRRDFAAAALWPRLGFVAVAEEPGRAKDAILTVWRFDLAARPLLKLLADASSSGAARVVIDANVFFDLDDVSPGEQESQNLMADWIGEFVELAVTDELLNEINRRDPQGERERHRLRARRFVQLPREVDREDEVSAKLASVLPASSSASASSDARHLVMTAASSALLFCTRDQRLLNAADEVYDAVGVRVLSPGEVVRRFDELRREEDYRPLRLGFGTSAQFRPVRVGDIDRLVSLVHDGQESPEPRRQTIKRVREMIAAPERYQAVCIEKDDEILAAYVIDTTGPDVVVPYFAVANSPLGRTAARHYAASIAREAAKQGRNVVTFWPGGARVADALRELGFSQVDARWTRLVVPKVAGVEEAAAEVERLTKDGPLRTLGGLLAGQLRTSATEADQAALLERVLAPLKLRGVGLGNFLVPIKPRWAKDLFDLDLGVGTLFGSDPDLALKLENVYYRSRRPEVLRAPGRILWYVSEDRAFAGSMAVRACSQLEEVVVGAPKDLFRRFRRLGVYEWSDVLELAGRETRRDVMAFRFSGTELFRNRIPWSEVQSVLVKHNGKGSPIQSPVAISEACFLEMYERGVGGRGA